jgi:hypothetical protein
VLTESPVAKENDVVPVLALTTFTVFPQALLKKSWSTKTVNEEAWKLLRYITLITLAMIELAYRDDIEPTFASMDVPLAELNPS